MSQPIPAASPARPMWLARWKSGKQHISADGIKTICGALIPERATLTRATPDWPGHVTCYNCAYRCVPPGYVPPANGQDFPLRPVCPHRSDPRSCPTCTPSTPQTAQNWPCPNGCTDPVGHDPRHRYTRCTTFPPKRPAGPDGRCTGGCESTERALHRANPRLHFDLADSASMICYHCQGEVCVSCQTVPVSDILTLCAPCSRTAATWPEH